MSYANSAMEWVINMVPVYIKYHTFEKNSINL